MPSIVSHGGGCCGRLHSSGYGQIYVGARPVTKQEIERHILQYKINEGARTRGKCIEAVITDNQFRRNPELAGWMKEAGFRLVERFHNSTGGMCNVLFRTGGRRDFRRAGMPEWVRTLRED